MNIQKWLFHSQSSFHSNLISWGVRLAKGFWQWSILGNPLSSKLLENNVAVHLLHYLIQKLVAYIFYTIFHLCSYYLCVVLIKWSSQYSLVKYLTRLILKIKLSTLGIRKPYFFSGNIVISSLFLGTITS